MLCWFFSFTETQSTQRKGKTLDLAMSIIERPWSEEAFRNIQSGTEYGTSIEDSNKKDPSAALEGKKSGKSQEGADEEEWWFKLFTPVPKGARDHPMCMIVCDLCGYEMGNDLMCPSCKRESLGFLKTVCRDCGALGVNRDNHNCNDQDFYDTFRSLEDESGSEDKFASDVADIELRSPSPCSYSDDGFDWASRPPCLLSSGSPTPPGSP